jgi:hypothetical protein
MISTPLIAGSRFAASHHSLISKAVALCIISTAILGIALIAPVVGHPRRYALWALAPFYLWVIAWQFGCALAEIGNGDRSTGNPQQGAGGRT